MSLYDELKSKYNIQAPTKISSKPYKTDGSVFDGLGTDYDWHTQGGETLKSWGNSLKEQQRSISKIDTSGTMYEYRKKILDYMQSDKRYGTDEAYTSTVNADIDKFNADLDAWNGERQKQYDKYQTMLDRYNAGAETWNKYLDEQKKQYDATYGNKEWLAAESEKAKADVEKANAEYAEAARGNNLWNKLGKYAAAAINGASGLTAEGAELASEAANAKNNKQAAKQEHEKAQSYQGTIEYFKSLKTEPQTAEEWEKYKTKTEEELNAQIAKAEKELNTLKSLNYNPNYTEEAALMGDATPTGYYDKRIAALQKQIDAAERAKERAKFDTEIGTIEARYASAKGEYDASVRDAKYAIVNGKLTAAEMESRYSDGTAMSPQMFKEYEYLSEDERRTYNAIYAAEGKDEAERYLDLIADRVSARRSAETTEAWQEFTYAAPITANIASVGTNLISGAGLADVALQNVVNKITGADRPVNYNTAAMQPYYAMNAVRGTTAQRLTDASGTIHIDDSHPLWKAMLDGKGLGDLYQLGMSMADSFAVGGIARALGGGKLATFMATSLLGGSAGTQGVISALEAGATDGQALAMGLMNGIFETLFEEVSIDKLINGSPKNIVLAMLQQGGIEATEEAATTFANTIADALIMAENSDWQKNVQKYIDGGMSEEEAKKAALKEAAGGLLYDALGGFISGGLMGGGASAIQNTAADIGAKRLYGGNEQRIVDRALEIDSGDRRAVAARDKLKAGEKLTGREIRGVMESGRKNDARQRIYDVTQQVQRELNDPNSRFGDGERIATVAPLPRNDSKRGSVTNYELAQTVAKRAVGEKLTRREEKALEASDKAKRILYDIQTTQMQKLEERFKEEDFKRVTVKTGDGEAEGKIARMRRNRETGEIEYDIETSEGLRTAKAGDVGMNDYAQYLGDMLTAALDDETRQDSAIAFNLYTYGQDIPAYAAEFAAARDTYGANGVKLEATKKSTYFSTLTQPQLEAAWAIGHEMWEKSGETSSVADATPSPSAEGEGFGGAENRSRAEGEGADKAQIRAGEVSYEGGTLDGERLDGADRASFTKEQQALDRTVQKISAMWGIDFVLFTSDGRTQGAYQSGGKIWVNIKNASQSAKMLAGQVLSHELTHWMQEYAPKEYAALKKYILEYMLDYDAAALEKSIAQKMARENITRKKALDEVIADGCQMMLKNSEAIKELARQSMTLAEKIKEAIEELILDLAALFGKPTHLEAQILAKAEELQRMWDTGMKAAAESMARENDTSQALRASSPQGEHTSGAAQTAASRENKNATGDGVKRSTRDEVLALGDTIDWMDNFSSIKDQLEKHRDELSEMSPIAEVTYAGEDHTELVNLIMEQVPKLGGSLMKRGSVSFDFDKSGASAIKTHARTPELRAAALAAPYVAKRGKLIAGQKNHEERGVASLTYAAPAIINGVRANVGVAIQFMENGRPQAVNIYAESPRASRKLKEATSGPRRGTGKSQVSSLLTTGNFFDKKLSQDDPTVNPKTQKSKADSVLEATQERARASEENRIRLKAANEKLKSTIARWEKESRTQAEARYNAEDMNAVYNELVEQTGFRPSSSRTSPMTTAEAREKLMALANFLIANKKAKSDADIERINTELFKMADELIGGMIENAWRYENLYDIGAEVRRYLSGQTVKLSDEAWGDMQHAGGVRAFPHVRISREKGIAIDTLWGELASTVSPGIFDPDTNEGDMLEILEDILSRPARQLVNTNFTYGESRGELIETMGTDLIIRLAGIREKTVAKKGTEAYLNQLRQEIKTGKRMNERLTELLASDEALYEAAMEELRVNKEGSEAYITELKSELYTARRRAYQAEMQREQLREQLGNRITELSAIAENTEKIIAAQRAKAEAKTEKLKERYDRIIEDLQRPERRAVLIRKIQRTEKHLQTFLIENSGAKHIPENMKLPIGELLEKLNTMPYTAREPSEKSERARYYDRRESVSAVVYRQRELDAKNESDTSSMLLDLPEDIIQRIKVYTFNVKANAEGEYNVSQMSYESLSELYEILTMISTAVKNANELIAGYTPSSLYARASQSIDYMSRVPERQRKSKAEDKAAKVIVWDNIMPVDAFARFGGEEIFNGFVKGWGQFSRNVKMVEDFANNLYTAKEARTWETTEHTFTLHTWSNQTKGAGEEREVTMTTAQLMNMYALMQRETLGRMQAQEHIFGGGIRIATYKNGLFAEKQQADNYNVTPEDWQKMYAELAKDERALYVIKELQKFANTVGTRWGNEISMKRWGIRFYTDKNYWTIRTVDEGRPTMRIGQESDNTSLYRLANMGFTKSTVKNASNAVVMDSALDVFANHMSDMAKYNALVLPLLDAMKWYNFYERPETDNGEKGNTGYGTRSLKKAMELAYGKNARDWFEQFLADINGVHEGGASEIDRIGSKVLRMSKSALVGANLRVVIQQPTSIARAMNVINPKYLAEGIFTAKGKDEMLKYSDLAAWKIDLGFYDVNINRSMRDRIKHSEGILDIIGDKQTMLAGWADEITWTAMWNAVKAEIKDKQGLSGEELLQAAGRRFDEVILKTQVMDSSLTRAQVMRKQSLWSSTVTAFMAEPILSAGQMMREGINYAYARRSGDKALAKRSAVGFFRAAGVFGISQALTAMASAVIDAGRDDDDYQTWLEKFFEHWKENMFDNANPLKLLPAVKLAWDLSQPLIEYLKTGKLTKSDSNILMQSVTEITELVPMINEWLNDDAEKTELTYYGNMTAWGVGQKFLNAVGRLTGVASGAAFRELRGAYNTAAQIWNDLNPDRRVQLIHTYDGGQERRIKYALADGNITAEEAIAELEKLEYDSDDAYWRVKSWQTGEGKTADIKKAIRADDAAAYKSAADELDTHGGSSESSARSYIKTLYLGDESTAKSIDRATAEKYLVSYAGMKKDEAKATVLEWDCKLVTGIAYDGIKEAFLDGKINGGTATRYLVTYGGMKQEDAQAKVKGYEFEAKWGFAPDKLKKEYLDGSISEAQLKKALAEKGAKQKEADQTAADYGFEKRNGFDPSKVQSLYVDGEISKAEASKALEYKGLDADEAGEKLADYDFEIKYGFAPNDTGTLYVDGEITDQQATAALKHKGLDDKEIKARFDTYAFRKETPEATDISDSAVESYNTFVPNMVGSFFYEVWKACGKMEGEDLNGDGENDSYTKIDKKLAYINGLRLSAEQKTRLALAMGIKEKTVKKRAPW